MVWNDTKLMESAIALAEELHFQRAARRLRISQPMLTKNIQDLEQQVGCVLFNRDRKNVSLSEPGRAYIQQARLAMLYGERAVQAARIAMQDGDTPFRVGRSPFVDPFLVSTLLSLQLPLFPRLKVDLISHYSLDLVDSVMAGIIDMAIVTQPPESPLITTVQVSETPLYVAMSKSDPLARLPSVSFSQINGRKWIVFERRIHPLIYDSIFQAAAQADAHPCELQHVSIPAEGFPFITGGMKIALTSKTSALLLARNGVTVRPLAEPKLRLRMHLVSRSDDDSKIASEVVRSFMRKISTIKTHRQLPLPLTA